ncbi:MAG TPA: hypothetical protein VGQ07_05610 [Nitrospirales bacterium]|jgi:hypothetical protein|nr:hypothetical protein [Nitrospirales bacterium]
MKALVVALFGMLLMVGMVITPSHAAPLSLLEPLVFAKSSTDGMIESVDPAELRVTILTDVGQKESLPVTNVAVLVGLTPGDRVNLEMNEDGKVKKIVKTTPIPKDFPAPEPKG